MPEPRVPLSAPRRLLVAVVRARTAQRQLGRLGKAGSHATVDPTTAITTPELMHLGADSYIGPQGYIAADGGLRIGRGVMIGPLVYLQTSTHVFEGDDLAALPYDHRIQAQGIDIEDFVWLGGRVTVLPGVHIGEGGVVGAGSVVVGDVPPLAIAAGNPARVIRYRDASQYAQLRATGMTHRLLLASGYTDTWLRE